jgi:class 3 adenylate cyclase
MAYEQHPYGSSGMSENEKKDENQISSVEIINNYSISRATINNYIKMGILPHPLIKRPEDYKISKAKRMGYFPHTVLNTLDKIIQYKKEGLRMMEICKLLAEMPTISSEKIQNSKATTNTEKIFFQRRVPNHGNESEELFSFEETHAGYVPADAETMKDIRITLRQGAVSLLHFSVLVAEIQDTGKMCAELPPDKYVGLIKRILKSMTLTFKKHLGMYGKHSGYGVVFYFLKDLDSSYLMNALLCALELREMMKNMCYEWKMKNEYFDDLYLNIGISEGHEFLGTIPAAPAVEYISLGDSVNSARQLSNLARFGSVWTTKNFLNLLDETDRKKIRYGIYRRVQNRVVLVENIFSRVMDLFPEDDLRYSKYMDIGTLPVTEIQNLR